MYAEAKFLASSLSEAVAKLKEGGGPGELSGDDGGEGVPDSVLAEQHCSLPRCGVLGRHAKCGQCKSAFYCCPEHQKEHWKAGHKAACRAMRASRKASHGSMLDQFDKLRAGSRPATGVCGSKGGKGGGGGGNNAAGGGGEGGGDGR